jgi:hypothetical protein
MNARRSGSLATVAWAALLCSAVLHPTSIRALGGSDTGGCYQWSDTLAPLDGNAPTFSFIDASASGAFLPLSDDQVSFPISLGFTFDFYGTDYSSVHVSSNGFLTFLAAQGNGCCSGDPIPDSGNPNGLIAGLWKDLYPPNGAIYYDTIGSAPNRQFVVQFQGVPECCGTNLPSTWEVILSEGTNEILVQYVDGQSGSNTTSLGIESQEGTMGAQWMFGSGIALFNEAVRYFPGSGLTDDGDGDGVVDCVDNCPADANPGQIDCDEDGTGDACDGDIVDADGDGIDDTCDDCPDDVANTCAKLYSIDRSAPTLHLVDPGTGATIRSVSISVDGQQPQGGNGLAADPQSGELWALVRGVAAAGECSADPSRTIFAGGPNTGACGDMPNKATCETAFHLGNDGIASCYWAGFSCRGCGPNNENSGNCVNTCRAGPPSCEGDPARGTFAGWPGSSACRDFDGDQASCETAFHLSGQGYFASCFYHVGTDQCRGCGPSNVSAGDCTNTCPVCEDDPSRTQFAGGFSACGAFLDEPSCEDAFHYSPNARLNTSCFWDGGTCRGCGPPNEGAGLCTNSCGIGDNVCGGDPTRMLFGGGSNSGACRNYDTQSLCDAAFHLTDECGFASCYWTGSQCRGCGPNNQSNGSCVNSCDPGPLTAPGRTLVTIDPTTGASTAIGNTGDQFAAISFDSDGNLYGTTGESACSPHSLFDLSTTDGSATFLSGLPNVGNGESLALNALDGNLYRASGSTGAGELQQIDPDSLAVTSFLFSGNAVFEPRALTHVSLTTPSGLFDETFLDTFLIAGSISGGSLARIDLDVNSVSGALVTSYAFLDHTSKGLAIVQPPSTTECTPAPQTGCVAPGKGVFLAKEKVAGKEKLKLVLKKLASPVTQADLGDPVTGDTRYDVCVYDENDALVQQLQVDRAGDQCGAKACWKALSTKGYKYSDKDTSADGVLKIVAKGGSAGLGKLVVKGLNNVTKGQNSLPTGTAAALENATKATVQVVTSDAECFGVTLNGVKKADGLIFKAVHP